MGQQSDGMPHQDEVEDILHELGKAALPHRQYLAWELGGALDKFDRISMFGRLDRATRDRLIAGFSLAWSNASSALGPAIDSSDLRDGMLGAITRTIAWGEDATARDGRRTSDLADAEYATRILRNLLHNHDLRMRRAEYRRVNLDRAA